MSPEIGRALADLTTPVLLLDVDDLDHNLRTMADRTRDAVGLRPHVKNFRSVDIARRQLALGALGVTAATVADARAMLDAGIGEVLLANQVVAPAKLDALLGGLPPGARPILAVDSAPGIAAAARAAERADLRLDVVLEVDVGMGRGGTRDVAESLGLAAVVAGESSLHLVGVMGYEGHTVLRPDATERAEGAASANALLAEHVAALREAGYELEIVAAGGTNTHTTSARHPVVTELQVGTYATLDVAYEPFVEGFRPALSMLAQVVSAHGDRVVLDAGVKSLGASALALPRSRDPRLRIERVNDEHALAVVEPGATAPAIGERVRLDVAAAGPAVMCWTRYVVVSGDRVVDVWPILPHDPGGAA